MYKTVLVMDKTYTGGQGVGRRNGKSSKYLYRRPIYYILYIIKFKTEKLAVCIIRLKVKAVK